MPLPFLPVTRDEIDALRWEYVDVVLVTGDAYVDHPSFGAAAIGRVLEHEGLRVALIPMPAWKSPDDIMRFGKPRLFFGVTSGNVDSMISRFTAFNKVRNDDPYAPGGRAGNRPERAVIVYCNMIRAACRDVPIVIGGIEASMRRFAHYDFWDNRVRRSILQDSRADLLVHGMGEQQVADIARRMQNGSSCSEIPGTSEIRRDVPAGALMLPSEEEVIADKDAYNRFYKLFYENQHRVLAMPAGKRFIVQYPSPEVTGEELDRIYSLPFSRKPHPVYGKDLIPAFEMIKDSVNSHRGCVSGCAFCSLGLHQGKKILPRSRESILEETGIIARNGDFHGHITDIGGPSANMYGTRCSARWDCRRPSCIFPELCKNLKINTQEWLQLLGEAGRISRVRHVTVGSGIRYDLFMRDDPGLLLELMHNHVSGQLKIAPEHTAPHVLRVMRKSPVYDPGEFAGRFSAGAARLGKKLYIVPYLMSCHPGCTLRDMETMKKDIFAAFHFIPEQVQAFIPLPLTLSSAIYYTGSDPITGEKVFVERDKSGRRRQHDAIRVKKSPPKK